MFFNISKYKAFSLWIVTLLLHTPNSKWYRVRPENAFKQNIDNDLLISGGIPWNCNFGGKASGAAYETQ